MALKAVAGFLLLWVPAFHPALASADDSATLQSTMDIFNSCIEQSILTELQLDPAARSAETVTGRCATHRASLDAWLGDGARAVLDEDTARRVGVALGLVAAPAGPAVPAEE